MEEKGLVPSAYHVFWHPQVEDDLADIPPHMGKDIVGNCQYKLSRAPRHLGRPLRGTKSLLYRVGIGSYRAVYTINEKALEVWVLAVRHRKDVYRQSRIEAILDLALALHAGRLRRKRGPPN